MLREDFHDRISIEEVNQSSWMTQTGVLSPVESFIPIREPLRMPLSSAVLQELGKFDLRIMWSTPKAIENDLTSFIQSVIYQRAVTKWQQIQKGPNSVSPTAVSTTPKRGFFGMKKREVVNTTPVSIDKNFFSVLCKSVGYGNVALYYLAQEKLLRDLERQKLPKEEVHVIKVRARS